MAQTVDEGKVRLLVNALTSLSALSAFDDVTKIKSLWNITKNDDDFSSKEYCAVINGIVDNESKVKFYVEFQQFIERLENQENVSSSSCGNLLAGILLSVNNLVKHWGILASTEIGLIVDPLIYISRILITDLRFTGIANGMLRLLGSTAEEKIIKRIIENNPNLHRDMKDALSEGVIKRNGGAYLILSEYWRSKELGSGKKPVSKSDLSVEGIQDEFGGAFLANDEAGKRVALSKLCELMGVDEAKDWLREYYPQCVGESVY